MRRTLAIILLLSLSANAWLVARRLIVNKPAAPNPTFTLVCPDDPDRYAKLAPRSDQVLFLGDSIPCFLVWNLEDKRNEGDLESIWRSTNFNSRCVPGFTSQDIDGMMDKIALPKAGIIYVWMGINDLLHHRSVIEIEVDYSNVLTKIRSQEPSARVNIISVLPVTNKPEINALVNVLDDWLQNQAKSTGDNFIDVRQAVSNENGAMNAAATWDGVHPNSVALEHIEKILSQKFISKAASL